MTPLHLAPDAPMAAVLLAAGAPVNAVNNAGALSPHAQPACHKLATHVTLLVLAASCNERLLMPELCTAWLLLLLLPLPCCYRHAVDELAGETPLFAAAAANAETVVRVLLQQGAIADHQDDCGETALIRAAGR